MEKKRNPQQRMEVVVLGLYAIYCIGLTAIIRDNNLPQVAIGLIWAGWILSVFIYGMKIQSYQFRSYFTTVMIMTGVVIYGVIIPDLFSNMGTIITITILFGLYKDLTIIILTNIPVTFLVVYHLFVVKDISQIPFGQWSIMLQQICSVYLAEYIVYYLVKKQLEINERQLKMIDDLRNAERSKDDFLANVSHEIRTPANTICGISEIILREEISDKVREDVSSIQEAGRTLISAVADILDFSELQSGKMQLEEVEYNITSTLNDVLNMSLTKKEDKNIEFIVDCSADVPSRLLGDEQKIRRVIMNLIDNAVKFTNEGCICIEVSSRKTDQGVNLMIGVRDTGIGIKEENLEKLFTSFSQADTKRNRQKGGLGLGLAISRALVDEMGGFITLKSTYGKGTLAKFVIPQKVVDETPIVVINNPEKINAAIYINIEHVAGIELRESYAKTMEHVVKGLGVKFHLCRNFVELKKVEEREPFTHMFLSLYAYQEQKEYFDQLSEEIKIIVMLDKSREVQIQNKRIGRIYKPFFIIPIAAILNEDSLGIPEESSRSDKNRFIAPEVHVLAVDDNEMNIRVLEGLLKPYQIKVTRASSGFEALEKIETMDYDFVFMDHMMPEMDGVETLHRIRKKQDRYYKNIPIIALTANAIAGMRGMFLEEGFQDFIAKPIELSVLERVLERNIPPFKMKKIEEAEKVPIEPESTQETGNNRFDLGDLNVKKGISYCGGMDSYIEILRMHCQEGDANKEKLQKFLDTEDLKNYIILVHGIKSSMKSIGADRLSEMAKELEFAGKDQNAEYIRQHHDEMITEYMRVLDILEKNELVNPKDANEDKIADLEVLSEEDFDAFTEELENAAYGLQKDEMLYILTKMENYSYHGHALEKPLEQVKKKVEMLDLMSATEVVHRLRARLRKQQ